MDLNKKYSRLSKYFLAVCLCILTACTVSYKFNGSSINYDKVKTISFQNFPNRSAAVILFYLGTGPIKGFAVTLAIGVILSMFSAITVTKFLLRFLISSNFTKNPAFFGVSAPKEVNK